jgi:hypothetical protein
VVQNLLDALKDLADNDEKDPETLLATLKLEDRQIYRRFVNADLPPRRHRKNLRSQKERGVQPSF